MIVACQKKNFFFDKMVTGQTSASDFCQKITHFLPIKENVLNGKNIYDQAPYFYISKKPFKFEMNLKRLSSNCGHRFKKRVFEKNEFKVLSIAYM